MLYSIPNVARVSSGRFLAELHQCTVLYSQPDIAEKLAEFRVWSTRSVSLDLHLRMLYCRGGPNPPIIKPSK